jgi:hypothetical protein
MWKLDDEHYKMSHYENLAKAALTAAADVGDQRWGDNTHRLLGEMIEHVKELQRTAAVGVGEPLKTKERWGFAGAVDAEMNAAVDRTIESCAKVAETFFNHPRQDLHRKIAAAIRALKDKP